MKNIESIKKAVDDADFLLTELTSANNGASALENIVLLNLISMAAEIKIRIHNFYSAINNRPDEP